MIRNEFVYRSYLPVAAETAFDWHLRPGAFERLMPPFEPVEVLDPGQGVAEGSRAVLRVPLGPMKVVWVAEHRDIVPGRQFRDVQVRGPFAAWEHTHRMEPAADGGCYLEDRIEYALPLGVMGKVFGGATARQKLRQMFAYRHAVTREDLMAHEAFTGRPRMNVLVSGSSGMVGSALVPFLTTGGHRVVRLKRSAAVAEGADPGVRSWNPESGRIDPGVFAGCDAVVHLAGENIAAGRWNAARKERIRDSRVKATRNLCEGLARARDKPRVLVCASATGFYGETGDREVDESSPPGSGFLPEVCVEWERATEPAREAGIRVVNIRIGLVLSPAGGALEQMVPLFRWGLGGVLGSGRQYMSWIGLDDLVGAIHYGLQRDDLVGPVNGVAPGACTNREFTRVLARVLGRPAAAPAPGFALRLALGEMADALLLMSTRVKPQRLLDAGYVFLHGELEGALRHVLGRAALQS